MGRCLRNKGERDIRNPEDTKCKGTQVTVHASYQDLQGWSHDLDSSKTHVLRQKSLDQTFSELLMEHFNAHIYHCTLQNL